MAKFRNPERSKRNEWALINALCAAKPRRKIDPEYVEDMAFKVAQTSDVCEGVHVRCVPEYGSDGTPSVGFLLCDPMLAPSVTLFCRLMSVSYLRQPWWGGVWRWPAAVGTNADFLIVRNRTELKGAVAPVLRREIQWWLDEQAEKMKRLKELSYG